MNRESGKFDLEWVGRGKGRVYDWSGIVFLSWLPQGVTLLWSDSKLAIYNIIVWSLIPKF